jgi:large subunit ribosomal protein L10
VNRQEKEQFIQKMHTEWKETEWAFLFDYRGLTVLEATRLRKSVKEANSYCKVIKNTLAIKAVKDTKVEPLSDSFSGPIAVVWTREDPIGLAKVLVDFTKETKKLEFKAGVVSGKVINAEEFTQLSKLPGREELIAQYLYVISSPIRGFVTALNEINSGFVRVLADIKRKKEQSN